jgi:CheY-like chemotaxis protein
VEFRAIGGIKLRILIADDDPIQQHFLERVLIGAGHDVCTADDGRHALAIYRTHPPFDCVVSDLEMPLMTGLELFEAIRKINPDQHFILQTSESRRLLPVQLHKPYSPKALLRALRAPVQPLLPL